MSFIDNPTGMMSGYFQETHSIYVTFNIYETLDSNLIKKYDSLKFNSVIKAPLIALCLHFVFNQKVVK